MVTEEFSLHKSGEPQLKSVKESEYSKLSHTPEEVVNIESDTSMSSISSSISSYQKQFTLMVPIVTLCLFRQRKEEETI